MGSARRTVVLLGIWGTGCAVERAPECTTVVEGVHSEGALGGHIRLPDVIWENTGGYTRFTVEGLDRDVQSVSVSLDREDVGAWVAQPDAPRDSESIRDYLHLWTVGSPMAELDPGVLESYLDAGVESLQFVVATPEAMPWSACVRLDTSPYLLLDEGRSVPVGGALSLDHDVWNEAEDVVIYPEGDLPGWVSWDRGTGRVTGTPTTAGVWEFTVVAEGRGGRRERPSGIASFRAETLECGERATFATDRGMEETPWALGGDPRSFAAFETPLPRAASSLTMRVTGFERSSSAHVAFLGPRPGGARPFLASDPAYAGEVEIRLDPSRWPSLREVRRVADRVVGQAGNRYGSVSDGAAHVECDDAPRLDLLALPVLPVGEATTWELPSVGGRGAIRWEGRDLPEGVTLSPEGQLSWSGVGDWSHQPVEIVLTDIDGVATVESVELFHGDEASVSGPVFRCGDTITGASDESASGEWFLETAARRSGRVEMVVDLGLGGHLLIGDPNGEWTLDPVSVGSEPMRIVLDEQSSVPLSAYAERPLGVTVRAWGDASSSITLLCGS